MTPGPYVVACVLSMTLAAGAHGSPQPPRSSTPLGGGDTPDIELSTTSLPFGNVHLGGFPIQSFFVSNAGAAYLDVSLTITGTGASQFFLVEPLQPFSVPPSGQVEIKLTFYPTSIGTHEASLDLSSNDPVDPLVSVSLTGNGYQANLVSLTGTPDPVATNGSITFTIVLDAPAGPTAVAVEIGTSPTALIDVPQIANVEQGETQAQFQATAGSIPGLETVYAWLNSLYVSDEIQILGSVGVDAAPAHTLRLGPVVPNPMRQTSRVAFALPSSARARLEVFDLMGRRVATVADGIFAAGPHEVPWKPATIRSGMYWLRLESLGETRVAKVVVTP